MSEPTPNPPTNAEQELRRFPNLTEQQEAFVWQLLANGGKQAEAARAAGYAKTSAHVTASRLMRNPAVSRALQEAAVTALASHVPKAIQQVAKLSSGAKSEYVRLEASRDLLDRVGLSAPKQVRVGGSLSVTFDLS